MATFHGIWNLKIEILHKLSEDRKNLLECDIPNSRIYAISPILKLKDLRKLGGSPNLLPQTWKCGHLGPQSRRNSVRFALPGMWDPKLDILHNLSEDRQIQLESGIPHSRCYVVCLHFESKDQETLPAQVH